ncbi:uncharacterized protein [Nicotiana sylvestris]|uniref:uncharacterized protein n=1 Tax=Nicotiana sylvestris TaxID=4096 RepID=UPI00388C55DF
MSNVNNNNQHNLPPQDPQHQMNDPDDRTPPPSPQHSQRQSREETPNRSESNENDRVANEQALDEAFKKLIAQQVVVELLASLAMENQKQLKEQSDRIGQIPGVPHVIKGIDMNKYLQQPWKPSAAPLPILKKFKMPDIPKYDGKTDPRDHGALTWYSLLPENSTNLAELADSFIKEHSGAQKVKKRMEDIFKIKQGDSELLREFVDRFQRERMMLPRVPDNWAAMAFASNLNEKCSEATRRLKESLREFPETTWNDVYNRYNTKLRIEEDTITQSQKEEMEMRSNPNRRNPDFWCEFHNDHGYKTTDCRLLQGEVDHLLKQGYLAELFSEKGKQAYMKNRQEPPKPPSPKRTVNFIRGGEEITGVTYMAAKKVSKITVTHGKRVRHVLEEESITFDDADADGVLTPHNDTLVISLLLHDTNVKRVLIDPGSSVNIILLRMVNEMQAEDKLIPKAHTLSGFDNSSVVTKGDIILTTFTKGVVKDTKFQVVEMDMAYNMILGRLWIHEMDIVPSTLHQVIFPSQWGIRKIRGDQQTSRSIISVADSSAKNKEK